MIQQKYLCRNSIIETKIEYQLLTIKCTWSFQIAYSYRRKLFYWKPRETSADWCCKEAEEFFCFSCLDKNEYNHITATYYLLAERKLRAKRQETANKGRRPENLAVPPNSLAPNRDNNNAGTVPCLLSVPRTPGDLPQVIIHKNERLMCYLMLKLFSPLFLHVLCSIKIT